jgi:flagellar basal body rod protein FlgG
MTTILGAAASGMQHHARVIDAVANNVANVNTAGFKRTRPLGEGAPSTIEQPMTPRMGVALTAFDVVQATGPARSTEDPLHFAIQDDAFFRVREADGSPVYTRFGALSLDSEGNVTAYGGRLLDPPLVVPQGATQAAIDDRGLVTALDGAGARQEVGQLAFFRFMNPQGLEEIGDGLYRETVNSGAVTEGIAGREAFAPLLTASIEGSNVDLAEEFTTLIIAQRAYQASAKTFSVGDQMLAVATDLTR